MFLVFSFGHPMGVGTLQNHRTEKKKDNIQVDISFFVQGFQCILRYAKLCQSSLEKIMIISKEKSDYGVVKKNQNEVEEDSQNEKKKKR